MDKNEGSESNLLNLVQEGMSVYDAQDETVGVVKALFLGGALSAVNAGDAHAGDEATTLTHEVTRQLEEAYLAVDLDESVPREARARLQRKGYMHIKATGLLQPDYYATADQIASVAGNRVYLNVRRGNVLTD